MIIVCEFINSTLQLTHKIKTNEHTDRLNKRIYQKVALKQITK